jgi:hypothetical protein
MARSGFTQSPHEIDPAGRFFPVFCHGQDANPFAKLGEFKSVEAFVTTVKAADLTKEEQPLAPIFVDQNTAPDSPKIVCDKVSTCAAVPQRGKIPLVNEAVVFANGSRGLKPNRQFVSVLFLLIRAGDQWMVADAKVIESTGRKEPGVPYLYDSAVMVPGLYYVDHDKHVLKYKGVR